MLYKAYTLARHQLNTAVSRILASGGFGSLLAFTLVNVTSAIPEGREGFYCLSVIYAAIAFAELDRRLHFHPSSSSTSHGITST
jgi:hypothetical protein